GDVRLQRQGSPGAGQEGGAVGQGRGAGAGAGAEGSGGRPGRQAARGGLVRRSGYPWWQNLGKGRVYLAAPQPQGASGTDLPPQGQEPRLPLEGAARGEGQAADRQAPALRLGVRTVRGPGRQARGRVALPSPGSGGRHDGQGRPLPRRGTDTRHEVRRVSSQEGPGYCLSGGRARQEQRFWRHQNRELRTPPAAGRITACPQPTPSERRAMPMSAPKTDWDPKGCWAPYVPDEQTPWDLRRVVHLHRRAGFAATWKELQ